MPTATAHIGDTVIATTDDPVIVGGNVYFPESDVANGVLIANKAKTLCFWKGVASYYDVSAGDATLRSAAFTYRHPLTVGAANQGPGRLLEWR